MVARLDAGLRHLGQVSARCLGRDFSHLPGAGAAGGLGFGMAAFCGAQLRMGIDAVLDLSLIHIWSSSLVEQVCLRIGFLLFSMTVARLGTTELAAHQIGGHRK